jgi:hypothetical protein
VEFFRPARLEQSGPGYQRLPAAHRFPYGHTHRTQEEIDVVLVVAALGSALDPVRT